MPRLPSKNHQAWQQTPFVSDDNACNFCIVINLNKYVNLYLTKSLRNRFVIAYFFIIHLSFLFVRTLRFHRTHFSSSRACLFFFFLLKLSKLKRKEKFSFLLDWKNSSTFQHRNVFSVYRSLMRQNEIQANDCFPCLSSAKNLENKRKRNGKTSTESMRTRSVFYSRDIHWPNPFDGHWS